MKIENTYWKVEKQVIEVIKISDLAQLPPRIAVKTGYGGIEVKKIVEVEPLNSEYAAVRFLEYEK